MRMIELETQALKDYILESRTSFWKMELEDKEARMHAGAIMQDLLGISPDTTGNIPEYSVWRMTSSPNGSSYRKTATCSRCAPIQRP